MFNLSANSCITFYPAVKKIHIPYLSLGIYISRGQWLPWYSVKYDETNLHSWWWLMGLDLFLKSKYLKAHEVKLNLFKISSIKMCLNRKFTKNDPKLQIINHGCDIDKLSIV